MSSPAEKQGLSEFREPDYRAYLLRCWREPEAGPDGRAAWRFCLMKPGDGQSQRPFANLEDLVVFLQKELKIA